MDVKELDVVWRSQNGISGDKFPSESLIVFVARQLKREIEQIENDQCVNLQGMNGDMQRRFDDLWRRYGVK